MLGWLIDWALFAVSAAVVREALASKRKLPAYPARVAARAVVTAAALPLAIPLELAVELWWKSVQHARSKYDRHTARKIIRFETAVIAVAAALYTLLPVWLLPRLWRALARQAAKNDPIDVGERPKVRVPALWAVGLLAATAFLARLAIQFSYYAVRDYRECVQTLGLRRTLRGVAMMLLLRLRQPRGEFFKMVPVVADMLPFGLCVFIYEVVPMAGFAAPLALLVAWIQIAMSIDHVCPPTWLFLATSDYEAFWVFDDLRHNWGRTAVCLLDRGTEQGTKFYQAEREHWERERGMPTGLFYDPTQPRVWHLRTRPDMWEHTVMLLTDYVPRIVVDLRQPSPYVLEEVQWLLEPSRLEKTLFFYDQRFGLLPEYAAVIPESARHRVLTGQELYSYRSA